MTDEVIEENTPPTVPTTPIPNPLLARVEMPGSTFQLPSRGLFYQNGELREDVEMGEVHIGPMSAYDEILMKTPDQLFSGEAVTKVFGRCIQQVLKPKELLARDVDFLLVCLRQVTYGNELEINYTHSCDDAEEQTYKILLTDFIGSTKKIDPTTIGSAYGVTMPNGQVVKLHPSKFKDVLTMYQDTRYEITPEEELDMNVFIIRSVISSVDGITNERHIEEWIKTISAGWLEKLSNSIANTGDFGPDFSLKTKCKDCGKDIKIQTPVNPISFFM